MRPVHSVKYAIKEIDGQLFLVNRDGGRVIFSIDLSHIDILFSPDDAVRMTANFICGEPK